MNKATRSKRDSRLDQELREKVIERFGQMASEARARGVARSWLTDLPDQTKRTQAILAVEVVASFIQSSWDRVLSEAERTFRARGLAEAVQRLRSRHTYQRKYAEDRVGYAVADSLLSEVPDMDFEGVEDWWDRLSGAHPEWRNAELENVRMVWELGIGADQTRNSRINATDADTELVSSGADPQTEQVKNEPGPKPSTDLVTQIERLAQLHESGHLNDAEFETAKANLLGS